MTFNLKKEIVNLLFDPNRLTNINLIEPDVHLRYIQAYTHLEFQEGYFLGLMNDRKIKLDLDFTVDYFVHSLREDKLENIIEFYNEMQQNVNKYNNALFFLFLHRANKKLNRYGLVNEKASLLNKYQQIK